MENVRELPAESTRAILSGLAIQERERETSLQRLARLRKEASAEIDRLIAFLDQSDPYVMTELEEECEDEGAQCEDEGAEHDGREPNVDDEPSLCGVTVTPGDGGRDLEADLGSLDRQIDQRRSLAGPGYWCAEGGECA
jgi:hypothetical protein